MSLNEINRFNINLYPNPTNDFINIDTHLNEYKIEIYDLLGKKVHSSDKKSLIDVRHIDNGMYLLNFISKFYSTSKLFIKK